ncbi:hypothetical protein [Halosegnis rubeus]|uniref:DUF8142 domain-containing protein n=1 Tax=Halosegnis rubeus TaxID=2212850 RepID=A0A5N5UGW8_9EURY|nr:hypothetical protein [Halosegnis rubeus]KAB7516931.1 hypothetical protein DMP03_06090 [Halosegnis rubeus]
MESDGSEFTLSRKRALRGILPFLALGVADVILLLEWGLDPLWGFMILPPILMISVLGWVAFRGGMIRNRGVEPGEDDPDDQ